MVSWEFKERGSWPFVLIVSSADEKLIIHPASPRHVVRSTVPIRACIWGLANTPTARVTCHVDEESEYPMQVVGGLWHCHGNSKEVPNGVHRISVCVPQPDAPAFDEISVLVNQVGYYHAPQRKSIDYENEIGAYRVKCHFGTQLGPNENGTKGPWPSWR